jgi:hypothetical protein
MSRKEARQLDDESLAQLRAILGEGHAPAMLARVAKLTTASLLRAAAGARFLPDRLGAVREGVQKLIAWNTRLEVGVAVSAEPIAKVTHLRLVPPSKGGDR